MGNKPVRRWNVGFLLLLMMCFLAACGSQKSGDLSMSETNSTENVTESKSDGSEDGQQISEENRILIAYFTWSENVLSLIHI